MKLKQTYIILLFSLAVCPLMQAQTYSQLWEQVNQADWKNQKQVVIKLTNDIYQKGVGENNFPQMLKAYMWRLKFRESLKPESFNEGLKELEQWAIRARKPVERRILHALIANLYAYDSYNRWTTEVAIRKVCSHSRQALADSIHLLATSTKDYDPVIFVYDPSLNSHSDLYRVLAFHVIKSLVKVGYKDNQSIIKSEIERIYNNLCSTYWNRKDKASYLISSLKYLKWKYKNKLYFDTFQDMNGPLRLTQDPYGAELDKLIEECKSSPICAEAFLAKANHYMYMEKLCPLALQACNDGLRLYPKYSQINELRMIRDRILMPVFELEMCPVTFPGEKIEAEITHCNLDGFTLRVFQNGKEVSSQHYPLIRPLDYRRKTIPFTFQAPDLGQYVLKFEPDTPASEIGEGTLYVTRFKVIYCRLPNNHCEVMTLDAKTGHPIPHSRITLYGGKKRTQMNTLATDARGKVVFSWNPEYTAFQASKGTDITPVYSFCDEKQPSRPLPVHGLKDLRVSILDISFAKQSEVNGTVCKDSLVHLNFKVLNRERQPLAMDGVYRLYRIKNEDSNQTEEIPFIVQSFISNKELAFNWKNIPSGAYLLKASAKRYVGHELTAERRIVLFSTKDKKPPVMSPIWLCQDTVRFDALHPAKLFFGTSEKDSYVLMNTRFSNNVQERTSTAFSDTILPIVFPYRNEYHNGMHVNFCLVKNGKIYQKNVIIEKGLPEDLTTMSWEEYCNRKETIDITIAPPIPTFSWVGECISGWWYFCHWKEKYYKIPYQYSDYLIEFPRFDRRRRILFSSSSDSD